MGLGSLYLRVNHWLNPRWDYPLYCDSLPEGEYCFKLERVEDKGYNFTYQDQSLLLSKVAVDVIEATIEQLKLEEIDEGTVKLQKVRPGIPSYQLDLKYEDGKAIIRSANPGTNEKIFQLVIHLKTILEQSGYHRVTIGRDNAFYGLARDYFAPGEVVHFKVLQPSDTSTYVSAEGVRLQREAFEGNYLHYSFIMPDREVKVEITMHNNMMNTMFTGTAPQGFMGMTMMNKLQHNGQVPPNPMNQVNQAKQKFCSECGAPNDKSAKFCTMCGRKF